MSTEQALLATIWERPHDDTPRLVYADWLEETGDPANVARAEFIRLQCELAELDEDDPRRPELEKREGRLWKAHGRTWRAGLPSPLKVGKFHRGFPHAGQQSVSGKKLLAFPEATLNAAPLWEFNVRALTAPMLPQLAVSPALARAGKLMIWERIRGVTPDLIGTLAGAAHGRHLTMLVLDDQPTGDEGVGAFADEALLPRLNSLWLNRNELTDAGVGRLSRWAGADRLTELGLDGNGLTDEALATIGSGPLGRNLTELLIAGNPRLTTRGLGAFLDSPACRDLRVLNIAYLKTVTNAVAEQIAESPRFAALRTLVLYGTGVGDRGVTAILRSPHLARLRFLNVHNSRVRSGGKVAAELKARFPGYY